MANPILRPGVFFVGYTNSYDLRFPEIYLANLPSRYDKVNKDVDNPKTSYHYWYESSGKKIDSVEQRKYLLKAIIEGAKSQSDDTKVSGVPVSDFDPKKVKKTGTKKSTTKKTGTKKGKKPVAKKDKKSTVEPNDEEYNDDDDDEYNTPPEQESNYIFDKSTIENTVLPDEIQLKSYKMPTAMPTTTSHTNTEEKKSSAITNMSTVTPASNDMVFDSMISLGWRDKDEGLMNISALNRIPSDRLLTIFPTMVKMSDDLFIDIHDKTGALDDAEPEDKYNFLFHVIAKGEAMYCQTIVDPDFCLYLLDQYQPLYTYMKKKLKIRDH